MRRGALALAAGALAACTQPSWGPPPHRARHIHQVDGGPTGDDLDAEVAAVVDAPVRPPPPHWLRGSTHLHARPSGDSQTPVADVIAWYEQHGYDFVVLTDHNKVTIVDHPSGLIVIPGVELTYNPAACEPPGDGTCRIHVNALGVTSPPAGKPDDKIDWPDRKARDRPAMYQAALDWIHAHGGLAQINHPQWHWGMTPELLRELVGRGFTLVEIANAQFRRWNAGDDHHPSMEALWDDALSSGLTVWGVASDDAHDYRADGGGKYPAGGAWIMVDAARDPAAILAAIAAGRFYASTGVALARAEVWDGALEIEVAPGDPGVHVIRFIGAGRVLAETTGERARFVLADAPGYVRAVITRDDGAHAWTQPARP